MISRIDVPGPPESNLWSAAGLQRAFVSNEIEDNIYDSDEEYDLPHEQIVNNPTVNPHFIKKQESINTLINKGIKPVVSINTFFKYALKYPRSKKVPTKKKYPFEWDCRNEPGVIRDVNKCMPVSLELRLFECFDCNKIFTATYDEVCLYKKHYKIIALKTNVDKFVFKDLKDHIDYYNFNLQHYSICHLF